ncbi:hypothetical protein BLA24_22935 [Streptomyces cinnamoneus]|uniref:Peptidase S8/S53 domain-containing protein n=1 Tax=Streptomyces cinnamoneus TaxID=53446 RepID=A0A2G1XEM8_STRCJ|nr:hypothetical protein BLA24_22935 [Streptomyces cinnamoneus]PPT16744.1 hypothetical protein CYQ11_23140 [Streptomyces cinnamoneus]
MMSVLGSLLAIGGGVAPPALADTMRERQWYLDKMQAEQMWKVSTGTGITVAVVDTGAKPSQPELAGKLLPGKTFGGHGSDDGSEDTAGHGTAMASLIAGNGAGGQGVKGLAPGAKILPVRVWGETFNEQAESVASTAKGIRYAADSEARIISISMSVGEHTLLDYQRTEMQNAIDYAIKRGKLIFAGSGNKGDEVNLPEYPAAAPGVAAVGALDKSFSRTKFSGYGPHIAFGAPGDEIPIPCDKGDTGYCRSNGTSQATALASASAALVWSMHPDWNGNQVLRVLMDTAGRPTTGKLPSDYVGWGSIRPRIAVLEGKGDPGPADVNPLVAAKAAAESKSPAPSDKSAAPSHAPALAGTKGKASDGKGGGSLIPWAIGGVVAAVGVGVGLNVWLRRKAAARAQAADPVTPTFHTNIPYGAPPPPDAPPFHAPHAPQPPHSGPTPGGGH